MFLVHGPVENDIAKVMMVVYQERELSEEALASGLHVDAVPEPDVSKGLPVLHINVATKEAFYEYNPIIPTALYPNTETGQMQKEIDDLKLLIAELVTGGAV